ncbi:MAG: DNA cytosine methyltransferase [Bacteroidales bacterium]|jgi:DNA (cytosine-5)-methyltransferase 1|nr:DNA cytosine methyltransferase [Bacteroidales bacterium]MDD2264732.1 DNA cytosine methyltransferase [Bacteroidales bacterium]MDD2831830.1 DNA cytosine methyltransferase [Bacteroidales bacterium]MDD3209171.1 DNA cytosine methyltransferase [Bacteroidales bacterium]MDD3697953.1 DNA cytosine methyltransferase [Bacteroidales bacterium]
MDKIKSNIGIIDLFCGIGGLTHGLKESGLQVKAGVDSDNNCKYAYEVNNEAKFIGEDISKIIGQELNKLWGKSKIKILVGCGYIEKLNSIKF